VQTVNGNSIEELTAALDAARAVQDQPKVLVCHTVMGSGVPLIEQLPKAHFVRVEQREWDAALQQLAEAHP
jgi:transketolase